MRKKILSWTLAIFLLFWLLSDPQGMAGTAEGLVTTIAGWAEQLFAAVLAFAREIG